MSIFSSDILKFMSHIFSMCRAPRSMFSKCNGMVLGFENGFPPLNFKIKKKIGGFPGGVVVKNPPAKT